MSHIIFADSFDLDLEISFLFITDRNHVSCLYFQLLRDFFCQNNFFFIQRISSIRRPFFQSHKLRELLFIFRHIQIDIVPFTSVSDCNLSQYAFHRIVYFCFFSKHLRDFTFFFFRSAFRHNDRSVISLNLAVLNIDNRKDRIFQTEPYDHQSHTSSDAENRHKKPFLISDKITHACFPGKIQPLPQKCNLLKNDSLTLLRRRRTHQLSRLFAQFLITCQYRRRQCTKQRRSRRSYPVHHIIRYEQFIHVFIHYPVCIDDNIRKYLLPGKNTGRASKKGRQKRISQIFPRYRMSRVSKRF